MDLQRDIPTEILGIILRLSTDVPDPIKYPQLVHTTGQDILSDFAVGRYRAALATKRSVVRVCRHWNALATPFLYEHISLNDIRQVQTLVETASRPSRVQVSQDDRILGHFVLRLDDLLPPSSAHANMGASVRSPAQHLCELLPNLATLFSTGGGTGGYSLPFSSAFAPRLEYLYWRTRADVDFPQWITFMNNHPHLIYVNTTLLKISGTTLDAEGASWPAVRELVCNTPGLVRIFGIMLPADALPNLQTLAFQNLPLLRELAREVLSLRGRNLTRIRVSHPRPPGDWYGFSTVAWALHLVEQLREFCPRLHELETRFFYDSLKVDFPVNTALPGVAVFRVQHCNIPQKRLWKKWEWERFFEDATAWINILPDLKTIRFVQELNVVHLRSPQEPKAMALFDSFLEQVCELRRLRVEDNFGRRLYSSRRGAT